MVAMVLLHLLSYIFNNCQYIKNCNIWGCSNIVLVSK